jgi:hypothetical protein
MKNHYLLYLFLAISFYSFGQTETAISDRYEAYFKQAIKEAVFVHLNKTTYLAGEEIWFKSYVLDKKYQSVSDVSTNLYVGIYDKKGFQVKKKLFRIRRGLSHGNLKLDESLNSGTYYIKAATQQMLDNNSLDVFVEEIVIYGNTATETEKEENTTKKYDIQFLPEGGHILKNVTNTIAFKAIDQTGKGIYATGIILDEEEKEVATFESNDLGFGTFQLTPETIQNYKAKIIFEEEKTTEQSLPKVESTGITIHVDNLVKDSLKISLNTNTETLRGIISKEYTVLIHKDGLVRAMPFSFKNNTTVDLSISRKRLFNGVNTVTLFDGNTPILERMFFNRKVAKNLSLVVQKTSTKKNTSQFSLYLVKTKSSVRNANVSISVLPESSQSYHPANNIISSFYLKPYVRGNIENPKYYFPNNTKTKRKALDALLITQGWSKYDWNTIFKNNITSRKDFLQGITITGKVNHPIKNIKGMFIHDTKNEKARYIPIDRERNFTIPELFPEAGERLRLSYVSNKKKFSQPKLFLKYSVTNEEDRINENIDVDRIFYNKNTIFKLPTDFFSKDSEDLNTVVLETVKKKKKKRDPMMMNGRETKITEVEYLRYPIIGDFIQNNGFEVIEGLALGKFNIVSRRSLTLGGLPTQSITVRNGAGGGSQAPAAPDSDPLPPPPVTAGSGSVSPLVFVDDVPLTSLDILANYSMANVERIVIDKTGLGYGVRGTGGVIKIYTRRTPLTATAKTPRGSFVESLSPIGFSVAKEYYVPKYNSFSSDIYEKYGAIDWRPNIIIPKRGSYDFSVKHEAMEAISFYIEGISENGSLISEKRTITLEDQR